MMCVLGKRSGEIRGQINEDYDIYYVLSIDASCYQCKQHKIKSYENTEIKV